MNLNLPFGVKLKNIYWSHCYYKLHVYNNNS